MAAEEYRPDLVLEEIARLLGTIVAGQLIGAHEYWYTPDRVARVPIWTDECLRADKAATANAATVYVLEPMREESEARVSNMQSEITGVFVCTIARQFPFDQQGPFSQATPDAVRVQSRMLADVRACLTGQPDSQRLLGSITWRVAIPLAEYSHAIGEVGAWVIVRLEVECTMRYRSSTP